MHKYLQSAAKAQLPEYTIVPTPRVTVAQSPRDTVTQSTRHTVAQSPRVTVAQSPRVTIAQSPRVTIAQSPRDTKSETPRSSFLGNLLLSTNESSSSSPGRRTNGLSGSADQRFVRVGGPTSCPGRQTKCNGCLPLSCAEA